METNQNLKKTGFINAVDNFLYGYYFPLLCAAWAFLCHTLNIQTAGFIILGAAGCFILVKSEDLTPFLPLVTTFVFALKDYSLLTTAPYLCLYAVLGACFLYHFVKFPIKSPRLGKLFFPLCLVSFALFLGGILSVYVIYYERGIPQAVASGPALLAVYLLFLNGLKPPKGFNLKTYLCYLIITATFFAGLEVMALYFKIGPREFMRYKTLGWGNCNTVGAMILIAVPLCCYMICKTGKTIALLAVIVAFFALDIFMECDGSSGILIFAAPFLIVTVFTKLRPKDRRQFMLCVFLFGVAACIAGIILLRSWGFDKLSAFINGRSTSNGRPVLYNKALLLFRNNPILGVGLGYFDETVYQSSLTFNFHSTVFQIIATMGTFGIIAYLIYYYFRIKTIVCGKTRFSVFAFFSFVLLQAYGIIDVCEFNVFPLAVYITIVTLAVELESIQNVRSDKSLPLKFLKISYN